MTKRAAYPAHARYAIWSLGSSVLTARFEPFADILSGRVSGSDEQKGLGQRGQSDDVSNHLHAAKGINDKK